MVFCLAQRQHLTIVSSLLELTIPAGSAGWLGCDPVNLSSLDQGVRSTGLSGLSSRQFPGPVRELQQLTCLSTILKGLSFNTNICRLQQSNPCCSEDSAP